MSEPTEELSRLPFWLLLLTCFCGISGELWRASMVDKPLTLPEILKRVSMRFGAASVFGIATYMVMVASNASQMLAVAACIVVATMGADIASAVYEKWLGKKL